MSRRAATMTGERSTTGKILLAASLVLLCTVSGCTARTDPATSGCDELQQSLEDLVLEYEAAAEELYDYLKFIPANRGWVSIDRVKSGDVPDWGTFGGERYDDLTQLARTGLHLIADDETGCFTAAEIASARAKLDTYQQG